MVLETVQSHDKNDDNCENVQNKSWVIHEFIVSCGTGYPGRRFPAFMRSSSRFRSRSHSLSFSFSFLFSFSFTLHNSSPGFVQLHKWICSLLFYTPSYRGRVGSEISQPCPSRTRTAGCWPGPRAWGGNNGWPDHEICLPDSHESP